MQEGVETNGEKSKTDDLIQEKTFVSQLASFQSYEDVRFAGSEAVYYLTFSIEWKASAADLLRGHRVRVSKSSRKYWKEHPEKWIDKCREINSALQKLSRVEPKYRPTFKCNLNTKEIHLDSCRYADRVKHFKMVNSDAAFELALQNDHDFCAFCLGGLDRR